MIIDLCNVQNSGKHTVSYSAGTGSFSRGYGGRGLGLTSHPFLKPMLKKEYNYTSIPSLGLHVLL